MKKSKLAIIISHPIQYYSPWFQFISSKNQIDLKVFYTWGASSITKYERDFGQFVTWDKNLLQGYNYIFLKNYAIKKGTNHFWGIINFDLKQEINKFNPDEIIVFGWSWWSHFWFITSYIGKAKLSFRGDSNLLDIKNSKLKEFLKYWLLKTIYSKIEKFYSVGVANESYYYMFGVSKNKIIRMPHCIDNEWFTSNKIERQNLRLHYQIKDHEIVLLFCGKLINKKSPELLLRSFIQSDRKDIWLFFIGSGILEEKLKNISDNHPKIKFLGFKNQTEMISMYSMGDIICLPSQGPNETWGLVVNEAMASGIPAIASDKCGCAEDLVKGNGFVFSNFDELVNILKNLNKEDLKIRGNKAAEIVRNNFSYETNYQILLNSLNEYQ
ncbi:MAG: glycosyltransferase family 4 protein [Bacteroidota bacterium]|nr:glycosyltransferase family 4 protein [Bacteroidota bacterium]